MYTVGVIVNVGVIVSVNVGVGVTDISERITVTPGLLANGSPTTNTNLTIDSSLIDANDNYGYIVEFDSVSDIIV